MRQTALLLLLLGVTLSLAGGLAPRDAQGDASFIVDSLGDEVDDDWTDGLCHTAVNTCTLQAASDESKFGTNGYVTITFAVTGTITTQNLSFRAATIDGPGVDQLTLQTNVSLCGPAIISEVRIIGSGSVFEYGISDTDSVSCAGDIVLDGVLVEEIHANSSAAVSRRGPGEMIIRDSIIRNSSQSGNGGGILALANGTSTSEALTIENSEISGNTAAQGGGLFSLMDVTIRSSVFRGNHGSLGGAIRFIPSNATIIDSTFEDNTSDGAGAIYWCCDGSISGSTFKNNTGGTTGAVHFAGGHLDITNSTFSGNGVVFPEVSGAIWICGFEGLCDLNPPTAALLNVTIANNDGGINSLDSGGVTLENTLLDNNGTNCIGTFTSDGNNLSSDSSCGLDGSGDIEDTDPEIEALDDNGGPSETHALSATSPAIDAGADCPDEDQRGEPRPEDGNGDGDAVCDIGAYEAAEVAPEPTATPTYVGTATPTPTSTPFPTATTVLSPTGGTGAGTLQPPSAGDAGLLERATHSKAVRLLGFVMAGMGALLFVSSGGARQGR